MSINVLLRLEKISPPYNASKSSKSYLTRYQIIESLTYLHYLKSQINSLERMTLSIL